MEKGRGRHDWGRTAEVVAKLHNMLRAGGEPIRPENINPYHQPDHPVTPPARHPIRVLKTVFIDHQIPPGP